jgi:hypothetical protein
MVTRTANDSMHQIISRKHLIALSVTNSDLAHADVRDANPWDRGDGRKMVLHTGAENLILDRSRVVTGRTWPAAKQVLHLLEALARDQTAATTRERVRDGPGTRTYPLDFSVLFGH